VNNIVTVKIGSKLHFSSFSLYKLTNPSLSLVFLTVKHNMFQLILYPGGLLDLETPLHLEQGQSPKD